MYKIYTIVNLVTGQEYIGSTGQHLEARFAQHCVSAFGRDFPNALCVGLREHGLFSFRIHQIASAATRKDALWIETQIMRDRNTMTPNGYNMKNEGVRQPGHFMSPETRRRIGRTLKKFYQANPEEGKRQGDVRRGRIYSPERIAAAAEGRKKNYTDEKRQRACVRAKEVAALHRDKFVAIGKKHVVRATERYRELLTDPVWRANKAFKTGMGIKRAALKKHYVRLEENFGAWKAQTGFSPWVNSFSWKS